jgi:predicted xylose isomerase-like sugar epimerase
VSEHGRTTLSADALVLSAPSLIRHRTPLGAEEIRSLVDVTADAGFAGMSIWTDHHDWAVADGMTSEEFFELHRARGLSMPAAEVIYDWAGLGRHAIAEANTHMLNVAAGAGAASMIAVTIVP